MIGFWLGRQFYINYETEQKQKVSTAKSEQKNNNE